MRSGIDANSGVRKKFPRETKVSSQSYDVTNQLYGEYQSHGKIEIQSERRTLAKNQLCFC